MEYFPAIIFGLLASAAIGALCGKQKNRQAEGLLLGLLLGPLGWIIILLFPEQGARCPECRGVIPAGARRCKHCAYVFPGTAVANDAPVGNTQRAYYVQNGEKTEGPFTARQLKALVAGGNLSPEALCARKGDPDWYPVSIVIE